MTAKEMFEELGYYPPKMILFSERNGHIKSLFRIVVTNAVEKVDRIHFFNKEKYYRKTTFTRLINRPLIYSQKYYETTSLEEHKAITQQMKELGWLDD